jgi:protein-L-isoaspartate(D-aspartate) O-methyltransferase
MVARQIEARGILDPAVLAAMRNVPRHRFVPESLRSQAYDDHPVPIGLGQTISQPYIVALMTELARPRAGMKVLEVGTGSGYQAAVLGEIVGSIDTIEILPELGRRAAETLRELGYRNVHVFIGDGFEGRPQDAPFDAIVVTAAPETIPPPLLEQLALGGRLVIPVGSAEQELVVVTRSAEGYRRESVIPVRFVPMTGKAQSP